MNSVVALAGINATGKTTALNLLELACRIVDGSPARGGGLPSTFPAAFDGPELKCVIWHADRLYSPESVLQTVEGGDDGPELSFSDEVISSLPASCLEALDPGILGRNRETRVPAVRRCRDAGLLGGAYAA